MFTSLAIGASMAALAILTAWLGVTAAWIVGIEDEIAKRHPAMLWLTVLSTVAAFASSGLSILLWHRALA